MKEIKIIILEKEDLKQFGFSPEDVSHIEVEDVGLAFHLKESIIKKNPKKVTLHKASKKAKNNSNTKVCKKCGKKKPNKDYYKTPKTKSGLDGTCRQCRIKSIQNNQKKKNKYSEIITAREPPKAEFNFVKEKPIELPEEPKKPIDVISKEDVSYTYPEIYAELKKKDFMKKQVVRELGITYKDAEESIRLNNLKKIDDELSELDDF